MPLSKKHVTWCCRVPTEEIMRCKCTPLLTAGAFPQVDKPLPSQPPSFTQMDSSFPPTPMSLIFLLQEAAQPMLGSWHCPLGCCCIASDSLQQQKPTQRTFGVGGECILAVVQSCQHHSAGLLQSRACWLGASPVPVVLSEQVLAT